MRETKQLQQRYLGLHTKILLAFVCLSCRGVIIRRNNIPRVLEKFEIRAIAA